MIATDLGPQKSEWYKPIITQTKVVTLIMIKFGQYIVILWL